jgi:diguanylate cyclase (GGDEF)-like protein
MLNDDVTRAATTFAVLDHSPIGHFVLRRDFVILFWNKCLEAWTGIPRGQIVGGTISHHFPNLGEPKYASRIQSMFDGGPPTIFSSQLHRHIIPAPLPSGKFRSQYTVVTGVPAEMEGMYALFSIQDVTSLTEAIENHNVALKRAMAEMEERKRAEAELVKTAQELKRLNDVLKERAIRDGHTGLYNHRYFYQILRRDFLLALRHQSDLSCLLLDLDNFKNVNDLYGHPFGDAVLKGVAGILQEHVRQTDLVCRYGGEEFAVLLPETDLAGAMLVAEELRARIAAHTFQSGPRCVQVTASTGVATLRAHSPSLPQELIAFSDKALYCAKAAGRNRVVVYSGETDYITP